MQLRYVTDAEPGVARRGGSRPYYVDQTTGRRIGDRDEIARFRALAVPPAWTDVWICADPAGHIQATGRDARGRKQYRYHAQFRSRRDRRKFSQVLPFGQALGSVRRAVDADVRRPGLPRERVLAAVIELLDLTYIRIGNEAYARDNKSFGLTTLRCRHVDVDRTNLRLRFPGKGGKPFDVTCCDARLARVVRRCKELPGQQLFQYLDADEEPALITSGDVNSYLHAITGLEVTAKTYRTWGATLLAAQQLQALDPPDSARAMAGVIKEALKPVAARLGNTVAVCRGSYVHPVVISEFEAGRLQTAWSQGPSRSAGGLAADERKLLHVLDRAR